MQYSDFILPLTTCGVRGPDLIKPVVVVLDQEWSNCFFRYIRRFRRPTSMTSEEAYYLTQVVSKNKYTYTLSLSLSNLLSSLSPTFLMYMYMYIYVSHMHIHIPPAMCTWGCVCGCGPPTSLYYCVCVCICVCGTSSFIVIMRLFIGPYVCVLLCVGRV